MSQGLGHCGRGAQGGPRTLGLPPILDGPF